MSSNEKLPVNFTCSDDAVGSFSAVFNVTSNQDSSPQQINVSCQMTNAAPEVQDSQVTPLIVSNGTSLFVSANITDTEGISAAYANIYYPNSSFWMNVSLFNSSSADIWEINSVTAPVNGPWGNYTVYIWANDSLNAVSNSEYTNFILYSTLPSLFSDIIINGSFDDWAGISFFSDPIEDIENNYNIVNVSLANNATNLFIRLAVNGSIDYSNSEYYRGFLSPEITLKSTLFQLIEKCVMFIFRNIYRFIPP